MKNTLNSVLKLNTYWCLVLFRSCLIYSDRELYNTLQVRRLGPSLNNLNKFSVSICRHLNWNKVVRSLLLTQGVIMLY